MSVTLGKIKARGLARADLQGSKFVSDDELTEYANAALAELFDILVQSFEDHLDPVIFEITTQASVESYALPNDIYKIRKVRLVDAAGNHKAWLTRGNLEDMHSAQSYNGLAYSKARYFPLGTKLYLSQIPTAGDVVQVWYLPRYEYIADDAHEIHYAVPVGWTEYVVLGIAMRCQDKEQTDTSGTLNALSVQAERIKKAAANRDIGEADQVIDKSRRFADSEDWLL
jgi:hypothetical protein